jgi:hypothetical protein
LVAVAVAAVALAACAQPGYSASKLQRELRRAGVSPQQAQCVTDAMENTFDPLKLGSHAEPSADDLARVRALLNKCGVKTPPR